MKIGYCSWTDPFDRRSWSGIHYFMISALGRHCGETVPLGPLNNKFILPLRILNKLSKIVLKKKFDYLRSPLAAKEFARVVESKIKNNDCDLLFIPEGSQILAYLKTDLPIIALSDTTFRLMAGYYPSFTGLFAFSERWSDDTEDRALKKADAVIYTSDWAAKNAIEYYKCSPAKINVIHFGANMNIVPLREDVMAKRKEQRPKLKMLFVGVDWARKGGEIAFRTMVELNNRGIDTELVVCGCKPPLGFKHEKMKVVNFLNKDDFKQAAQLNDLYMESSMFVLPTRSECSAVVYCEAAAYGLPLISTDTGGVSSYVRDGVNGYLLSLQAGPEVYADTIQSIWKDRSRYLALCEMSRSRFDNDLNWDSWALKVKEIIEKLTKA